MVWPFTKSVTESKPSENQKELPTNVPIASNNGGSDKEQLEKVKKLVEHIKNMNIAGTYNKLIKLVLEWKKVSHKDEGDDKATAKDAQHDMLLSEIGSMIEEIASLLLNSALEEPVNMKKLQEKINQMKSKIDMFFSNEDMSDDDNRRIKEILNDIMKTITMVNTQTGGKTRRNLRKRNNKRKSRRAH